MGKSQCGGISFDKQLFTLAAGDITNQYIDLPQVSKANSIDFFFQGVVQTETVDYTVNLTGGAGGKTRITFTGDLAAAGATPLVATSVIVIKYNY